MQAAEGDVPRDALRPLSDGQITLLKLLYSIYIIDGRLEHYHWPVICDHGVHIAFFLHSPTNADRILAILYVSY